MAAVCLRTWLLQLLPKGARDFVVPPRPLALCSADFSSIFCCVFPAAAAASAAFLLILFNLFIVRVCHSVCAGVCVSAGDHCAAVAAVAVAVAGENPKVPRDSAKC